MQMEPMPSNSSSLKAWFDNNVTYETPLKITGKGNMISVIAYKLKDIMRIHIAPL